MLILQQTLLMGVASLGGGAFEQGVSGAPQARVDSQNAGGVDRRLAHLFVRTV